MNWRWALVGTVIVAFAACSGGSSETKDVTEVTDTAEDGLDMTDDLPLDTSDVEPDLPLDETSEPDLPDIQEVDVQEVTEVDTEEIDVPLDTNMCPADCDDGDDCTFDKCVEGTGCVYEPIPNCCQGQQAFAANFDGENAFDGYEVEVTVPPYLDNPGLDSMSWQVTDVKSHSPGQSLYFGDPVQMNFDNGHRVAAKVTTPPFTLEADRLYTMAFWIYLGVEQGIYSDFLTLFVVLDGNEYGVWHKSNQATDKWIQEFVDLTPYAGEEIKLVFYFDSNNEKANSGEGVFIDDISITKDCEAFNECTNIAQCDDGNPCTGEACEGGVCVWTLNTDCCFNISNCEDWDNCTIEKCVSGECAWQNDPSPLCCNENSECDDGDDVCTDDVCINGRCQFMPSGAPGCCVTNDDCDDGDNCTTDECIDATCVHTNLCCETDDDCDDGDDVCTLDVCNDGICQFPPTGAEGCCFSELVNENFEDGVAQGWAFDASNETQLNWEVGEFDAYSGNWSMAAQGNNITSTMSVQAIIPVGIVPPVGGMLKFRLKVSMASSGDCTDNIFEVKFNDEVLVEYCNSIVEWLLVEVPLDGQAGETGTLSLDFRVSPGSLSDYNVLVDNVMLTQACCSSDDDCNDDNACTTDSCPGPNSVCQFDFIPGCCLADSECEDENPCTIDQCIDNECNYVDQCCESDAECNDADDVCTTDLCIGGWCYFQPTGAAGCCEPEQYFESFESNSLSGWTVENESAQYGWRLSDFQAHTGNFSLYYGDEFATSYGSSNEGTITGPPIHVPAAPSAQVRLWAWYDTESNWDEVVLRAVLEDGTVVGVAEFSGNSMGWVQLEYDISDVAGQTVQLQAYFDCDFSGGGQGAFLDDIEVIIGCCAVDEDCEDNNPCTEDFCPGEQSNCANVPLEGCCLNNDDCWDGDQCTVDRCEDDNTCSHEYICCETDADCDDNDDVCTTDLCIDSFCFYQPTGEPGCCTPEYADYGFEEGDLSAWVVENPNNDSAWRISEDAFEGDYSLYFGKADESEYNSSSDASIETAEWIELPVSDELTLDFDTKYDMESCCDDYSVYLVTEDEEVSLQEINGTQSDWTHKSYDIAEYSGQNVKIKFTFHSDGSVQRDGPHIDNVQILKSCCYEDADCDDGNPCTLDSCPGEQSDCINQPLPGCCIETADCDDDDPCTIDSCSEDNQCVNENICCSSDAECDDGDGVCTEDLCVDSYCEYNWIPGPTCCQPDFSREDFETQSLDGYEINNAGDGTWHITTADSVSGNAALIYADESDSEYGNNNNSVLLTPQVEIPENVIGPKLSFWVRYETESNYDGCELFIVSGEEESQLQNFTGSGNNEWTLVEYDLTPYIGSTIQLRFHFTSDSSVGYYQGILIDDIAFTQDCCSSVDDCDDGNPCTVDICTGTSGYCEYEAVPDCCVSNDDCNDDDECTQDICNAENDCENVNICCVEDSDCNDDDEVCTYDQCNDEGFCEFVYTGAPGCCTEPYFFDNFSSDLGWEYGEQWERGQAQSSSCAYSSYEDDPSTDHTGSADDNIAGIAIGGCINDDNDDTFYWLTSPETDTSAANTLMLGYWRVLNSDKTPYLNNMVDVWDGSQWVRIWESGGDTTAEMSWTYMEHDVSQHANAAFKVRFGTEVQETYAWASPSWNLDDVVLFSSADTLCCTYGSDCAGFDLQCANGACLSECLPYCANKECGSDGCGGSCGNCPDPQVCTEDGMCCTPDCTDKVCGDDGCGGSCGTCDVNESCIDFGCVCDEGSEACGDVCCDAGDVCFDGACCSPDCDGKECGSDACGGVCGECVEGQQCGDDFMCMCDYEYFGFTDDVQKTSYLAFGMSGMTGEGLDVDADETTCTPAGNCEAGIDNQLGGVLSSIAGLVNPNGILANGVADGSITILIESQGLKTDGTEFSTHIYTGAPAQPLGECDILTQTCSYYLDEEAFSPETCRGYIFMDNAHINGSEFRAGGPGHEISVPMPLMDGTSIMVTASSARIWGEVMMDGDNFTLTNAMIGGALDKQLLLETINNIPDDVELPLSKATIITLMEELLVPDIDLDGDGEADAVSVALKFETIPATIVGVQ